MKYQNKNIVSAYHSLSISAAAVASYSMLKLLPSSSLINVETDDAGFSLAYLIPKKIGEEFRPILQEMIRSIAIQDLPFSSFSMIPQVAWGYIEDKNIQLDSLLASTLEASENKYDSTPHVIDIVQIGNSFCTLRSQKLEIEYLASTQQIKWTEIVQIATYDHTKKIAASTQYGEKNLKKRQESQFFVVIRGVVANNAKEIKHTKEHIARYLHDDQITKYLHQKGQCLFFDCLPKTSVFSFHHDELIGDGENGRWDTPFQKTPIIVPAYSTIAQQICSDMKAIELRFPAITSSAYDPISHFPFETLFAIKSVWKEYFHLAVTTKTPCRGWFAAMLSIRQKDILASQHLLPFISHQTSFSLYSEMQAQASVAVSCIADLVEQHVIRKCSSKEGKKNSLKCHIVHSVQPNKKEKKREQSGIGEETASLQKALFAKLSSSTENAAGYDIIMTASSSRLASYQCALFFSQEIVPEYRRFYVQSGIFIEKAKPSLSPNYKETYRILYIPYFSFERSFAMSAIS